MVKHNLTTYLPTYDNDGKTDNKGSGCGSVGRAVASDTRGPQFESSHRLRIFLKKTKKTDNKIDTF